MRISLFDKNNDKYVIEAANLLERAFPQAYKDCGLEEIHKILDEDRIAVMAVEDDKLIGLAGAIPQYGNTGWELHPLVVDEDCRGKHIGSKLEAFLIENIKKAGGIMVYLGTDDEFQKTSLSFTDLFDDPFSKIKAIENLDNHPYSFYLKIGYIICGVIPDANGKGKPDIIMAKRIT